MRARTESRGQNQLLSAGFSPFCRLDLQPITLFRVALAGDIGRLLSAEVTIVYNHVTGLAAGHVTSVATCQSVASSATTEKM